MNAPYLPFARVSNPLAHWQPDTPAYLHLAEQTRRSRQAFNELLKRAPAIAQGAEGAIQQPSKATDDWTSYWEGRAKGSPLIRRDLARQHYEQYFIATLHESLATGELTTAEARAALAVLDNPEWLISGTRRIAINAHSTLPGALLLSIEGQPEQLLYQPGQWPPFRAFPTLQAVEESHLLTAPAPLEYQALDGIADGCDALLDAQQKQRSDNGEVFAAGPEAATSEELQDGQQSLHDFGGLGLDVPASVRARLVRDQLERLNALTAEQAEALKTCRQSYAKARATVATHVDTLLASAKWHSDANPVTASPELLQAHRDGLKGLANIHRLLGHIDDAELGWINQVAEATNQGVVVASLAMQSETDLPSALTDLWVICKQLPNAAANADEALLLYGAGENGGLLRFVGLDHLQRCLNIHHGDGLSLHLTAMTGDMPAKILNDSLSSSRQAFKAIQDEQGLDTAAQALPQLRDTLAQRLRLPRHAAREAAEQVFDRQQSIITQAGGSLASLERMPAQDRTALRTLVKDYASALQAATALLDRELPARQSFCQRLVTRRLKQDFEGYDGSPIQLDLPLSTSISGTDLIGGSGAPGTPIKRLLMPSTEREVVALESVLLTNVDKVMGDRLRFMRVVLDSKAPAEQITLLEGLTATYLRNLAQELDLAQQYETQITEAFMGIDESDHAHAYRRECLVEPYRLMLQMQGLLARGHLTLAGRTLLNLAIDAGGATDYQAKGLDVRLLSARLSAGGTDTDNNGSTLSGITFIEDRSSKVTLLYLPDHPTQILRQYADLESARHGLFVLSKDSREASYLASRALEGDPAAHRSRLQQAHAHAYSGMIQTQEWPRTTSLATHQLNAQMGRMIQAHRASARSNLDLHVSHLAAQANSVFLGFKVALGIVPFLGLPVSVYDLFQSSAELVDALSSERSGDVLEALNNVLVSIIDVAIDVLGGGIGIAGIQGVARQRQLASLGRSLSLHAPNKVATAKRAARFATYAPSQPVSLGAIPAATHGRYRGIHRLADGDYVQVQGQPYKVRWDDTHHTWELDGNTNTTYRRAIALDEQGEWDTHFALYGVHRYGAGAGGGQTLGHLADTLDPFWPAAIRERLPQWWRDRALRQHLRLRSSIANELNILKSKSAALNQRMKRSFGLEDAKDAALIADLKAFTTAAERIHADCLAFDRVSTGRIRNQMRQQANELAVQACDARSRQCRLAGFRMTAVLDEIDRLKTLAYSKADELSIAPIARRDSLIDELLALGRKIATLRKAMSAQVEEISLLVNGMRTWRARVTNSAPYPQVKLIDEQLKRFSAPVLDYLALSQLSARLLKPLHRLDGGFINLQRLMKKPHEELDRALFALHELGNASPGANQRNAILTGSIGHIQQFKARLRYWKSSYPDYLDSDVVSRFETRLERYEQYFSRHLNNNAPLPPNRETGQSKPRVLETADNRYLIAEPVERQTNTYRITGVNGHTEIYTQDASGKFTLTNPLPIDRQSIRRANLGELRAEANRHLATLTDYRRQVQRHADQGLQGASADDLMQFKALDLEGIANRIAAEEATDPLVSRLRDESQALVREGHALRITAIKQTREPNAGQLNYLLERQQVRIEKVGDIVELQRQVDGRPDFMQEFVVLDITQSPPSALWYAHFHFSRKAPAFAEFTKGHLKTPAQRYQGNEWQATPIERVWHGDISRAVAQLHFADLF